METDECAVRVTTTEVKEVKFYSEDCAVNFQPDTELQLELMPIPGLILNPKNNETGAPKSKSMIRLQPPYIHFGQRKSLVALNFYL